VTWRGLVVVGVLLGLVMLVLNAVHLPGAAQIDARSNAVEIRVAGALTLSGLRGRDLVIEGASSLQLPDGRDPLAPGPRGGREEALSLGVETGPQPGALTSVTIHAAPRQVVRIRRLSGAGAATPSMARYQVQIDGTATDGESSIEAVIQKGQAVYPGQGHPAYYTERGSGAPLKFLRGPSARGPRDGREEPRELCLDMTVDADHSGSIDPVEIAGLQFMSLGGAAATPLSGLLDADVTFLSSANKTWKARRGVVLALGGVEATLHAMELRPDGIYVNATGRVGSAEFVIGRERMQLNPTVLEYLRNAQSLQLVLGGIGVLTSLIYLYERARKGSS